MKLVRKTLLSLTALTVVIGLASCKMGAGEGDTKGNKWDLTMTVDATANASTPLASGKVFRRFWKQFSSSEKVAEITTTITIDPSQIVYPTDGTAPACVIGLIFDLNKNATDTNKVDFNLIGVNPKTQKFYVERYVGITKQNDESYDGTQAETSLATAANPAEDLETVTKAGGWCSLNTNMYKLDSETGVITCPVKITQASKKYTVYLNDVKVAEYDASTSTNVDTIDDVEYAVGGIACYGNAGTGVKIVANYTTDKSSVTGKLEAEEIEE